MKEVRICWRGPVDSMEGHGLWFPDTEKNHALLTAWVESACETHGLGSHWLEEREA